MSNPSINGLKTQGVINGFPVDTLLIRPNYTITSLQMKLQSNFLLLQLRFDIRQIAEAL